MGRREQLAEVFRDTQNFYQNNSILTHSVHNSMKETRLYGADDYPVLPARAESLCRCSTLCPTMDQKWLWEHFYQANRAAHDPLHSDACIYSPGVVICKTDDDVPARLRPEEFAAVDVISCAAPNLRLSRDGKAVDISYGELRRLLRCRAMHILHIAAKQVDVLVLGAFGAEFLERLIVEHLNALHSGKQLAIPIMGGEYILFIEGPAAGEMGW